MKILYHHRIRSKDGQFVHLEEMVKALREAGHTVIVCGPAGIDDDEFGTSGKLIPWLKKRLPKVLYELLELGYAAPDYRRLASAIRQHRPDVIYERYNLFLPSGVWAQRRFNLPLLLEVNAPLCEERKEHDGLALERLASWSQTFCWRNANMTLPVTAVLGEQIMAAGVPGARVEVIHNAINEAAFSDAISVEKAKERLQISGLVLGFVGFVRDWHGLDRVIRMLAQKEFQDAELVIVGDGPARATLETQARKLGVIKRVHILGLKPREEIPDLIAAFDVALQPKVVPYASPLKIYEYMYLSKAIVAPDTANIREILVHEKSALLFQQDSDESFEASMLRLVNDSQLRCQLGREARAKIKADDISWPSNAARVVKLATECIERSLGD